MNKFEKLIRETITLRVISIAVVTLIIGMPLFYVHKYVPEPWSVLIRALAETFLIAGFVGIIYDLFLRRRFEDEMKYAVLQAMNADAGLLKGKKLKDETVDSIMKNCLEAKLDDKDKAKIFFDGLISPAISLENHRSTFDYKITFKKLEKDVSVDKVTFKQDSYFRMIEKLTFTKHLIFKKDMELIVGVCFADDQLEHYKSKECIYRVVLKLKENERDKIKTIVKENSFPENIFKITIKIKDKELTPQSISIYDDMEGIKITYKYKDEEITADEETTVEIEVTTFHDRKANYYTAYLYDPTLNPRIKLEYNDDMGKPLCITYFMCSKGEELRPRDRDEGKFICVSTKINEWVFPTSGVVFIWKV